MPILARISKSHTRRRRRRRRLRSLAFAPTLLTIAHLLCGFAAIHFALRAMYDFGAGVPMNASQTLNSAMLDRMLPSFLSVGCGLCVLGMVFDCLDGLAARATDSVSYFGSQLDSLADIVTHGVAPAILMVAFMTTQLAGDSIVPSPLSNHFLGRACWVAAAVFVAFAAIRLARYNVEHANEDSDRGSFHGLPSPGAGGVIVSLIIFQDLVGDVGKLRIAYAMPFVAVAVAFLMISSIPYKRFFRAYLLGHQPFGHVVTFLLLAAVFLVHKAPTLLIMVLWYAVSGPVEMLYTALRGKTATPSVDASYQTNARKRKAG